LLLVDNILKKGARNVLPVMQEAARAFEEVGQLNGSEKAPEGYFEEKDYYVANFKKVALMLLKAVSEKFTRTLVLEQEILSNISDCIIQLYAAESVVLRVKKMEAINSSADTSLYREMVDVFVYDVASRIRKYALDTTYSFAYGEVRDQLEKGIAHFTAVAGVNVKEARRKIADRLIDENKYCF
jgi:hypothetical protein